MQLCEAECNFLVPNSCDCLKLKEQNNGKISTKRPITKSVFTSWCKHLPANSPYFCARILPNSFSMVSEHTQ